MCVLLLIATASCSYEDVDVGGVQKLNIEKMDNQGVELSGVLKIKNPNNYKIKITSSDADLFLDGRKAGKAKLLKTILVPANYNDLVEVNIRTDFENGSLSMLPIILGAGVKRRVTVGIEGKLRAKSFLISKSFPFSYTHEATF